MIDLPSKKVMATGLLTIVLVLSIIVVSAKNKDAILDSTFFVNKDLDLGNSSKEDLDGDGLLDWEEEMWGTDITNPDTDGDGTEDGEEVRRGRNPLVAGPNDLILSNSPEYYLVEQKQVSDNFEEGSISDNLSKSFFSDFLRIDDTGTLGTVGTEADLANIIKSATGQVKFDDEYTLADIQTFDAENVELLTNYATVVAQLEIDKLVRLSEMPTTATTADTVNIITDHHRALAAVSVPDIFAKLHLSIINDYAKFNTALENLDNTSNDPVKAMVSVQEIEGIQAKQYALFSDMALYFRDRGIIFNENEVESLWDQY